MLRTVAGSRCAVKAQAAEGITVVLLPTDYPVAMLMHSI
jgi:hypothetical protein